MALLWIAQTTVATTADAQVLARSAVEQSLAACVHVEPHLTSFFHWEGKLEEDAEVRLTFKTTAARLPALKAMIRDEHPYDVPEWIAWPIGDVSAEYLAWAEERVRDVDE
jgi:periplasmic divalent cation tolerance protein